MGGIDVARGRKELDSTDLHAKPRAGPLPAHDVHVLETDFAAADTDNLRCPGPGDMHCAAAAHEHTAAGAGADERPNLYRSLAQTGRAFDVRSQVGQGPGYAGLSPGHGTRAEGRGNPGAVETLRRA